MVAHFKRAYDKHARIGSAKPPTTQGCDSANNATDQAKEDVLQLMLQLLSNQKEVAEAAPADKEHLQAMSDSNSELLEIIKKLNQQNEKLTEQNTKLSESLSKAKSSRGGGGGKRNKGEDGGDSGSSSGSANSMCKPPKCGICGKKHKTENCFELEKNKDKHSDNWKSIFE